MVQPLLWQPLEPQSRPTAVESMSSRAGDMHECDVRRFVAHSQLTVSTQITGQINSGTHWYCVSATIDLQ